MPPTITPDEFVTRWSKSRGQEDKVDRQFFLELCDLLGVEKPSPANEDQVLYCFQKAVKIVHADGAETTKKIDFYKRGHFVIEAKHGSDAGDRTVGTARRGTEGWRQAMRAAWAQGHEYAINLPEGRPPFLLTCDIGHVFEIWTGFSGSYGGYGAAQRIEFADLKKAEVREHLRRIFVDPHSLNPALHAAKVTREVAEHLAKLAQHLEPEFGAERTSAFLMRCIFTMFAEDVGLLDGKLFSKAIKDVWLPDPASFPEGLSGLWDAMDKGLKFGFKKLLRFNGGLFASTEALPLSKLQLQELLDAANRDWAAVEPTIFGTLVERALCDDDRQRLGAHFTPREYIERLIRPAVVEPIRDDWTLALGQARQMMAAASVDAKGAPCEPTKGEREAATKVLREFHAGLCKLRILDPACGSGNFLYVSFALLKEIEDEVLREIADLGDTGVRLELENLSVNPSQFLGLEANPRAREIADLVLWIGYLQWHRKARGEARPVEPVLRTYKNIVCSDAVLAWDSRTERRDDAGRLLTVWNMRTYVPSPVTGELVPSNAPEARAPLYDYANPRAAEWPAADFIVSNPPFCGNKPMRKALGDSYTEALRAVHKQVPKTSDLVMYWWDHAAALVRAGKVRRFGLITTNSITQKFNRKVVAEHTGAKKEPLAIAYAIADHPWVLSGAAVRIAMTVGVRAADFKKQAIIATVTSEHRGDAGENLTWGVEVLSRSFATVHADLTGGADVAGATRLRANRGMSFMGVTLVGDGFRMTEAELNAAGYSILALPAALKPYMIGRDLTQGGADRYVIDFHGLTTEQARDRYPPLFQRVRDRVKPEREQNKDKGPARDWWLHGRARQELRAALPGLTRYIITPETAKHRFFVFAPMNLLADHSLYAITADDALVLGVLSSQVHLAWCSAAGATLEDRPRWRNTTCFEPFPFPTPKDTQAARIRDLAEKLDCHRKSVLTDGFLAARSEASHLRVADSAASFSITMTGMYNALERVRAAEAGGKPLAYAERAFHDRALIGVLKSLHADLDAAVAEAYGWEADLSDEEILNRLVALNTERAAEESTGTVRWLRPDLQNPSGEAGAAAEPEQIGLLPDDDTDEADAADKLEWPKGVQGQLKAVRDVLVARNGAWTAEAVARSFHNAQQRIVERHLGTLEGLGALASYDDGKARRWGVLGAGTG